MPLSSALLPLHLLLIVGGAFLVGMRVFRATQPHGAAPDEDSLQLQRLATAASWGLFLLLLALVVAADLGMVRVAGMIR